MKKLVLDSSVLIKHWNQCCSRARSMNALTDADVRKWAKALIGIHDTDAIVTPVVIELLAGTRTSKELHLTRAYLSQFRCVDEQDVTHEDWERAAELAQRIRRDGRRRQLGDCLIRAIAGRLRFEVWTYDQG